MRLLLPVLFFLGGSILFGIGAYIHVGHEDLVARADQVVGTVTSVRSERDSEGSTTYAPVYSYATDSGTHDYSPNVTSSSRPTVGETVTLFVDPTDPDEVLADTFMDRYFLPALLCGLGATFVLVSLFVLVATRAARRRTRHAAFAPALDASVPASVDANATAIAGTKATSSADPFVDGDDDASGRGPFL